MSPRSWNDWRRALSASLALSTLLLWVGCRSSDELSAGSRKPARQAAGGLELVAAEVDPETGFALNAFPPPMTDTAWHQDAWYTQDCLECHGEGSDDAPKIQHAGMPENLLHARCRTCHVLIAEQ